jgi:hypothetical protein
MKSLILVFFAILGLSVHAREAAAIKEKTLLFIPAHAFMRAKTLDWGLYIELAPDGKFTNIEYFETGVGQCHGKYSFVGNDLELKLETCGGSESGNEKHEVVQILRSEAMPMSKLLAANSIGRYKRADENDSYSKIDVEIKVDGRLKDSEPHAMYVYRDSFANLPTK